MMEAIQKVGEGVSLIDTIKTTPKKRKTLLEGVIPQARAAERAWR